MKRVYICAPLGDGTEAEQKRAVEYARYVMKCGAAPVAPHFYLCLEENKPGERAAIRAAGKSLLWLCDELWLFGDEVTADMAAELQLCKNLNINVKKIRDSDVQKKLKGDRP